MVMTPGKMCFIHNMEKLCNLSEIFMANLIVSMEIVWSMYGDEIVWRKCGK